jgi:hypothetical protein
VTIANVHLDRVDVVGIRVDFVPSTKAFGIKVVADFRLVVDR